MRLTNVGADTPEAYGDYLAWGETTPQASNAYNWISYKHYGGGHLTKYTGSDGLTMLEASDDPATANWGGVLRTPTADELRELCDNCTRKWTTQNGVNGHLFTAMNGNSIFLPAAGGRRDGEFFGTGSGGVYWSSSLRADNLYDAWYFDFNSGNFGVYYSSRYKGFTVRPVCPAQN